MALARRLDGSGGTRGCLVVGRSRSLLVAGDVQDYLYQQVVVAAGSGAIAAMEAEKYLGEYPLPEIEAEKQEKGAS